jgi:hypothetical protein
MDAGQAYTCEVVQAARGEAVGRASGFE